MATYTEEVRLYDAANENDTLIATLSEDIEGDTIPVKSTLAYRTYAATYVFGRAYISGVSSRFYSYQDINLTLSTTKKIVFLFHPKTSIQAFSWTSDDATKIVKGAPSTALTADAFNRLLSLYKLLNFTGSNLTLSAVSKGDAISWYNYRLLFGGIGMANNVIDAEWYRQSMSFFNSHYPSGTTTRVIYAELLANHEYSIKNSINRLIDYAKP